jgi:hypothetical protein
MIPQQWRELVADALAESGLPWQVASAWCSPDATTCSAQFSKKGEKLRQINVLVEPQADEAPKVEIIRQLLAAAD